MSLPTVQMEFLSPLLPLAWDQQAVVRRHTHSLTCLHTGTLGKGAELLASETMLHSDIEAVIHQAGDSLSVDEQSAINRPIASGSAFTTSIVMCLW